jgi:hypothetical protein
VLVAVLTAATMLGAFSATAGPNHGVPLKGSHEEVLTSGVAAEDGFHFRYDGTGEGTHVGRYTVVVTGIVRSDGTITGETDFTAANGDELRFAFNGGAGETTFTITGGTGRFTNATGGGKVVSVSSDGGIHVTDTYEGTIQF